MSAPAPTDFLGRLLSQWEDELRVLQKHGCKEAIETKGADIRDLRERYLEFQLEELTLEQGAEWSGLSYDGLRKKVERGEIPNAGEKGRPRVRRCDLPMKPSGAPDGLPKGGSGTIAGRILAARQGR